LNKFKDSTNKIQLVEKTFVNFPWQSLLQEEKIFLTQNKLKILLFPNKNKKDFIQNLSYLIIKEKLFILIKPSTKLLLTLSTTSLEKAIKNKFKN
jgi:hypothetical protein